MAICDNLIQTIESQECLTDSLTKINSNFNNLQITFRSLKDRIDKLVQVRTFFFYGPNAANDAASGMDDGQATLPSPNTIYAFVNSPTQLNLPAISNLNDIAYVVYQKTGFQYSLANTNPGISTDFTWGQLASESELAYYFRPTLVIWRLVFNGSDYAITTGFPKYHGEITNDNAALWTNPRSWSQF